MDLWIAWGRGSSGRRCDGMKAVERLWSKVDKCARSYGRRVARVYWSRSRSEATADWVGGSESSLAVVRRHA